jgi:hypothetical protein
MGKAYGVIGLLFFSMVAGSGQNDPLSNARMRRHAVDTAAIRLDSLPVIPGALEVRDLKTWRRVDASAYLLSGNELRWRLPPAALPDSVAIFYRVLPYDLRRPLSRFDTAAFGPRAADDGRPIAVYNPFDREDPLIDFRGLDYNGAFARGLSFGNNQDLVLNSSFNLQLAGDLGEGFELLAAISDENLPIQPEGNTQQLQEFDKIFVQLKKDNSRLTAGDYELRRPNSYFMNYFKKLQGATFANTATLGEGRLHTEASVAIARGQFARNQIDQQEGNQGPYKLQGTQGERFIIVLSGTESVWLDGRPLKRGLEEDYIIDYNRGEITFTNRRLVTKDSRIIVEFEYSDQSYLRSMLALNSEYTRGNLRFHVNLLSQQDSKHSSGSQPLSDAQKRLLARAGNDSRLAAVSGVDTLGEFNPQRAMYLEMDTLLPCGRRDTILLFSADAFRARLTARFSYVGPGNGNYTLDPAQAANERVYRWVEPDPATCAPRGDYAPVIPLTPPQQQALLSAGADVRLSPTAVWRAEIALSRNDRNRFSTLDNYDNNGWAFFTQFDKTFTLSPGEEGWRLKTDWNYEVAQQNFRAFNPYRDPEFLRDWSLADRQGLGQVDAATEHLVRGGLQLEKPGQLALRYELGGFLRDSLYEGLRQGAKVFWRWKNLELDGDGSLLSSRRPDFHSRFLRPRLRLTQHLPKWGGWRFGLYTEMEKNDRLDRLADTLHHSSFYYDLMRFFIRGAEQAKFQMETHLTLRQDYDPAGEAFEKSAAAADWNINGRWQAARHWQLAGNLTYRRLDLRRPSPNAERSGETFLGRFDASLQLWKGALRVSSTYELGAGQEPKLEFSFVRVRKGEGTHIWLDSLYNNDGVIQPHEMEIAPFPDQADFVRVTTFTDQFIRANYVNLNQNIQLNPKAVWHSAKDWRRWLARFATQSTLKINRKTQDAPGVSPWNPFQLDVADTALVAVTAGMRNVLFFNRAHPKYDVQLGRVDNASKIVQTNGFESRRLLEQFLRVRWNLSAAFSLQGSIASGERQSDSEFFPLKSYLIVFRQVEPQFTFLPTRSFRAVFRYKYQQDENQAPSIETEGESARHHDLNCEATLNQSSVSALRLRATFVHVDFSGRANSPVGFAMLNGLSPGKNFLWELSFERQVARNLQMRLSYEGRKTGAAKMAHVGRVQVAATF